MNTWRNTQTGVVCQKPGDPKGDGRWDSPRTCCARAPPGKRSPRPPELLTRALPGGNEGQAPSASLTLPSPTRPGQMGSH